MGVVSLVSRLLRSLQVVYPDGAFGLVCEWCLVMGVVGHTVSPVVRSLAGCVSVIEDMDREPLGVLVWLRREWALFRGVVILAGVSAGYWDSVGERELVDDFLYLRGKGSAGGVLDPFYEASALEVLRPGDLLWVVGRR